MEILIGAHTLERAAERGTDEAELRDVIATGLPIPSKHGRLGKVKIYDFRKARRGKYYEQKKVEVFYTVEGQTIVSVTVYVFYGRWEPEHADSLQHQD